MLCDCCGRERENATNQAPIKEKRTRQGILVRVGDVVEVRIPYNGAVETRRVAVLCPDETFGYINPKVSGYCWCGLSYVTCNLTIRQQSICPHAICRCTDVCQDVPCSPVVKKGTVTAKLDEVLNAFRTRPVAVAMQMLEDLRKSIECSGVESATEQNKKPSKK